MINRERNASLKDSHNNTINTGDTYYINSPTMLNRTRLYDFCKAFSEIDGLDEPDYSIDLPSDISEKINYNELKEFKEVFLDVSHTLEDVETVLSEIPKRGNVIRKIKGVYLNFKIEKNYKNKDNLCRLVFNELLQIVNTSIDKNELYMEDTYFAIQSLMYYAFTKCQILDKVPK